MAVHQCLSLSQVVSVPSHANGMTMATTWRQCESYTCDGKECQGFARTGQRGLVDAFLADYRDGAKAAPTPPAQAQPAPTVPLEAGIGGASSGPAEQTWKPVLKFSVVYYIAYIVMCLAVLARWEWCR
jgi:hypothetical protein